jgi:heptosyltransferase-1
MHRSVRRVIPVAVRRWRASLWSGDAWREIGAWRRELKTQRYDAVIDTQSLFKSALIARTACGRRHGLDRASAREWLAASFYDARHAVPRDMHAVERNRRLTALALGFSVSGPPEYGLTVPHGERTGDVVLLTMTSRADKLWAEENWIELARAMRAPAVLPWGSAEERLRAQRIAAAIGGSVLPRQSLEELAKVFVSARAVVGLDTGLTHFAAALGAPTVGIYCASDPARTGIYGAPRAHNVGARGRGPEVAEVLRLLE